MMFLTLFNDIRIGRRMALALALPMIASLFLAGMLLYERYGTATEMDTVRDMAILAPKIGSAVHELQKERGQSAVFLSSKGKKFTDSLPRQRRSSDKVLQDLREAFSAFDFSALSGRFATDAAAAIKRLDKLAAMRKAVDELRPTVGDMAAYYTPTIASLLTLIDEMGHLSEDPHLVRQIDAYSGLLQAKERAGLERAIGGAGFARRHFSPELYRKFISLRAQQDVFMERFLQDPSPAQAALYQKIKQDPSIAEVEKMRRIADESVATGKPADVDPGAWFKTITVKIDLLKKLEDLTEKELTAYATKMRNSALTVLFADLAGILLLLAVSSWLGMRIARSITEPLAEIVERMKDLAAGRLDIDISGRSRRDEIGDIARTVEVFKEHAIENRRMEEEKRAREEQDKREAIARADEQRRLAEEKLARENAERRKIEERIRATESFTAEVTAIIDNVANAAVQLRQSAETMAESTGISQQRTETVSATIDTARENAQAVAAATEQLSNAIQEISQQVVLSNNIADGAVKQSDSTYVTVKELADAVQAIGEVVDLITDIAAQTNLLALNATIEAARAGEAGKGFAVVANEVKNLATQTARATDEIRNQIENVQGRTKAAVSAIQAISGTIGEMDNVSSSIAAAVEQQGAATRDIAQNVTQVSQGAVAMSSDIQTVETAITDTGQAADRVLGAADQLAQSAASLKNKVQEFTSRINAA